MLMVFVALDVTSECLEIDSFIAISQSISQPDFLHLLLSILLATFTCGNSSESRLLLGTLVAIKETIEIIFGLEVTTFINLDALRVRNTGYQYICPLDSFLSSFVTKWHGKPDHCTSGNHYFWPESKREPSTYRQYCPT